MEEPQKLRSGLENRFRVKRNRLEFCLLLMSLDLVKYNKTVVSSWKYLVAAKARQLEEKKKKGWLHNEIELKA